MKCPFCGHLETQAVETRISEDADFIRRRQCGACEKRFTTPVAQMRCASVYRSFGDIDEFKTLVDEGPRPEAPHRDA